MFHDTLLLLPIYTSTLCLLQEQGELKTPVESKVGPPHSVWSWSHPPSGAGNVRTEDTHMDSASSRGVMLVLTDHAAGCLAMRPLLLRVLCFQKHVSLGVEHSQVQPHPPDFRYVSLGLIGSYEVKNRITNLPFQLRTQASKMGKLKLHSC